MKLTRERVVEIATEMGLLSPRSWLRRQRDGDIVIALAHGPLMDRRVVALSRKADESALRDAINSQ